MADSCWKSMFCFSCWSCASSSTVRPFCQFRGYRGSSLGLIEVNLLYCMSSCNTFVSRGCSLSLDSKVHCWLLVLPIRVFEECTGLEPACAVSNASILTLAFDSRVGPHRLLTAPTCWRQHSRDWHLTWRRHRHHWGRPGLRLVLTPRWNRQRIISYSTANNFGRYMSSRCRSLNKFYCSDFVKHLVLTVLFRDLMNVHKSTNYNLITNYI